MLPLWHPCPHPRWPLMRPPMRPPNTYAFLVSCENSTQLIKLEIGYNLLLYLRSYNDCLCT
jgi:hypothetical protein